MLDEKIFLKLQDYSVTNEHFTLIHDEELDLLITKPHPKSSDLWRYYSSEDYISHTSSKRSILEKVYHVVRDISIKKKLSLLQQLQDEGSLLDIGTGTGDFLSAANKAGWKTVGVEPNENASRLATNKGLIISEDTSLLETSSFDIITMWHVLEHVANYELQILELKRLIKPTGTIVIAVPNFKSYDAQYYKQHWAAYDVPRHLWHFSRISIQKIFAKFSLQLVDVKPMKFDSYYVSLLSEKYKSGSMNYLKGFLVGFISNWKAMKTSEYSSHIYILKKSTTTFK